MNNLGVTLETRMLINQTESKNITESFSTTKIRFFFTYIHVAVTEYKGGVRDHMVRLAVNFARTEGFYSRK
jgi:hypothetical protein